MKKKIILLILIIILIFNIKTYTHAGDAIVGVDCMGAYISTQLYFYIPEFGLDCNKPWCLSSELIYVIPHGEILFGNCTSQEFGCDADLSCNDVTCDGKRAGKPSRTVTKYIKKCPGVYDVYFGWSSYIYSSGAIICCPDVGDLPLFERKPFGSFTIPPFNPTLEIKASSNIVYKNSHISIQVFAKCGNKDITNEQELAWGWIVEQDGMSEFVGSGPIPPKICIPVIFNAYDGVKQKPGKFRIKATLHYCSTVKEVSQEFIWVESTPVLIPLPTPTCLITTNNPIFIQSGEKYDESYDVKLKNPGYDLVFYRIYRSSWVGANYQGSIGNMGDGWRTNYDYTIMEKTQFLKRYFSEYGVWHEIPQPIDNMGYNNLTAGEDPPPGSPVPEEPRGFMSGGQKVYPEKLLYLKFPNGAINTFRAEFIREEPSGELIYSDEFTIPGHNWKVIKQNDSVRTYKLIKDNQVMYFDHQGRLTAIKDLGDKGVTLTYNASNTIVTDNYGRQIIINKNAEGMIDYINTPAGLINYNHQYGLLLTADRPGMEDAEYFYGWKSRLIYSKKDLLKEGWEKSIEYRIAWIGSGYKYYEENFGNYFGPILTNIQYNNTIVTDKDGRRTYYFNSFGLVSSIAWANGVETREYNNYGQLVRARYKNGTEEVYCYDTNNRLYRVQTTWSDPLAGIRTKNEYYEYDTNNNLRKYRLENPGGVDVIMEYIYDSNGRITHILQGAQDISYTYYANGNIRTIHDGERMSKTYTYDIYGNVTQIRNNATGGVETFTYYNGGIDGKLWTHTGEDGITRTYTYDTNFPSKIKTIQITGADGSETITYTYNQNGDIIQMSDSMGVISYTYGENYNGWNVPLLKTETNRVGLIKTYYYDNFARIKMITDNAGGSRTYLYDESGNIKGITDGRGKTTYYYYDNMGNRISVVDRNSKITQYTYDGLSRLRKIKDANNAETEYDYDNAGNRVYIKDANGNETRYEYDGKNQMKKETFDDGSYIRYTYSVAGDLKKREVYNADGSLQKTQSFSYDNGHRLLNDGIYTYTYGASGCSCANRVETVTDLRGVTSYEYDFKGRVKKATYPDGTIVESIYNESAKTRTVKMDGNILFVLNLDGEGRATAVAENIGAGESREWIIQRDYTGRITQMQYPNKDKSITDYDVEGRITKHRNYYKTHLINKFEYTLDNEGNKKVEKTNIGMRSYGYDNIYQLTSATYERSQSFSWVYDPAGNRISSAEWQMPNAVYTTNNLNQYTSVNGVNYSYDSDGNLLSDGTKTMSWDIRNRLTQVIKDGKTVSYKYDHNDLRVVKTLNLEPSTLNETRYYYDGSLLLAEKDGDGRVQKVYVNDGDGILGFVRYIYNDVGTFSHYQRLYYLYDSLGSVSYITGENGLPLQNYTYTPYGSTLNVERDALNGLRFVGRYGGYKDDDSGLTYFWHRWYDEEDGRWVSRDPVGVCGGNNLYSHTQNNPLNKLDWDGKFILPATVVTVTMAGLYAYQIYGNYCGGGWTGGKITLFGLNRPNFNIEPIDDLDTCCKQHDKDWYDCEEANKCNPNKNIRIQECKRIKNNDFCSCLKSVVAASGTHKDDYLNMAKDWFKCK